MGDFWTRFREKNRKMRKALDTVERLIQSEDRRERVRKSINDPALSSRIDSIAEEIARSTTRHKPPADAPADPDIHEESTDMSTVTIRTKGRFEKALTKAVAAGAITWHQAEIASARLSRGQTPSNEVMNKIGVFAKSIEEDDQRTPDPSHLINQAEGDRLVRRTGSGSDQHRHGYYDPAAAAAAADPFGGIPAELFWRKARQAMLNGSLELRDLSIAEDRLAKGEALPASMIELVRETHID